MNEQARVESGKEAQPHTADTVEQVRTRAVGAWSSAASALRRPAIGASVAGAAVLAAGAFWGVTEAALAAVAVWAVFRTLSKHKEKEMKPAVEAEPASV